MRASQSPSISLRFGGGALAERLRGLATLKWSALVMLVIAGVWTLSLSRPAVWNVTGIGQSGVPFFDLYGLLAAGELAALGGNPYALNPLDPYLRPHVYTGWWLATGSIGLTRADTLWLGRLQLALTLVAAIALIRPRRASEALFMIAVLASPALLMAVNRGNNDLVVFIVLCGALGCLRQAIPGFRLLGAIFVATAAVLKYYPLAAIGVALAARSRREFWLAIGATALVLLLAWPDLAPGLASAGRFKPSPQGLYAFGAPALFIALELRSPNSWALAAGLLVAALSGWSTREQWKQPPGSAPPRTLDLEFFCGAALIVGCFSLGASYVYKMIFAVWLLPRLWTSGASPAATLRLRLTRRILLAMLWFEGVTAIVINTLIGPRSVSLANEVLSAAIVTSQLLTWLLIALLSRELAAWGISQGRRLFGSGSVPSLTAIRAEGSAVRVPPSPSDADPARNW